MEKSAYFIGTQTESLLAIPADWEHSTGNTPYFNRYNLEQIKGMSEGFTSKFPYKIVTTIEWSKTKSASNIMCPHMWEHFMETNKTNQSPKDCFSSPHVGIFSSILQSYSETYCVRSLSRAEVFCFDLGLASRSWGPEAQAQEEVWVEEEGLAIHFHQSAWGVHP